MTVILKIYKASEKLKRVSLSIWLSYLAGISVEYISNSSSFSELIYNIFDLSKISVLILWISALTVAIIWIFNYVFDKIRASKKIEAQFTKIMKARTYELLNTSELTTYSWGYNKVICAPTNPGGWKPTDIYIDLKNSQVDTDYSFNSVNLPNYNDTEYLAYCKNNPKIQTIKQRNTDEDHYGVMHIEKSMRGNKVELRVQKNCWTQLQFSWDYLRKLDTHNEPIAEANENEKTNNIFIKALNHDKNLLINSFCLHLILISNSGKVILSKISRIKSNDYPSTWAATLGEQIKRSDFLNDSTGETYPDFITRWTKRALSEELGIDDSSLTDKGIPETEEYVDMDSLRVLSINFEGDIYNIAITCVLKLKIGANQLKSVKELKIDSNEITNEFKEITESEIRKILLEYPKNIKEYHPSTYLRLLMFLLYSCKQSSTMSSIVKDNKKLSKRNKH